MTLFSFFDFIFFPSTLSWVDVWKVETANLELQVSFAKEPYKKVFSPPLYLGWMSGRLKLQIFIETLHFHV